MKKQQFPLEPSEIIPPPVESCSSAVMPVVMKHSLTSSSFWKSLFFTTGYILLLWEIRARTQGRSWKAGMSLIRELTAKEQQQKPGWNAA